MRYAEFVVGQMIELGPVGVSQEQVLAFAREHDPQWFHVDPERAASGRWGGLIASGWQTCALAMRMVVENLLHDSEAFGSPGLSYLKWLTPVRPGDALSLRLTVLETRRSGSGAVGSVRWRWQMFNASAVEVLDLEATSLFDLSPAHETHSPAGR